MPETEFLFSKLKDIPPTNLPEIALVGRSNVGKSSLLNHLLGAKKLAKVSAVPGKTQLLNFFKVDEKFIVVDFPGYGFADVPEKLRRNWATNINVYLETRKELKLIILLLDIRRTASEQDISMAHFANAKGIPLLTVFTKIDKVSSNEKAASISKNLKVLYPAKAEVVAYSIKEGECRKVLYEKCLRMLGL
ncbi:MAG: YihA family ribosome biogenesis GTP-binding protein [Simkaniaceae bacterium]|nr:YihA family ribosome biogenesis GTP-binding protein [Simkaniaceae bacterium]